MLHFNYLRPVIFTTEMFFYNQNENQNESDIKEFWLNMGAKISCKKLSALTGSSSLGTYVQELAARLYLYSIPTEVMIFSKTEISLTHFSILPNLLENFFPWFFVVLKNVATELTFTCSKSTMETPYQCKISVQS